MPRIARVVVPGVLHHVTQRGNNRQDVFLTNSDREEYLALLKQKARQCGVNVLSYCLMTNHIHLLVRPDYAESLAEALGRTHFSYAQRFNSDHARSGHLWQARFYSCPVEEGALFTLLRYVERNPVRAGIVGQAWTYPWSSAALHVGKQDKEGLIDTVAWSSLMAGAEWRSYLQEAEDRDRLNEIRRKTMVGRPFGSAGFINRLEKKLGFQLTARPRGRPSGSKAGQHDRK
jgi:putative transposase